jgi:hypothetical protein
VSYTVTYYCPRCGTLAALEREGYLDDKSVTPYPLEGWTYVAPDKSFDDADGVRFVCGEPAAGLTWQTPPTPDDAADTIPADDSVDDNSVDDEPVADDGPPGCGEPFYLSFVRFEAGEEIDPRGPSEQVELAEGENPSGPGGPRGPGGPSGFWG